MNEKLIMPVKARHFKNAMFDSNSECALASAAKEFFNVKIVGEGVDEIYISQTEGEKSWYSHEIYAHERFEKDEIAARESNFDETVILQIELTPFEK